MGSPPGPGLALWMAALCTQCKAAGVGPAQDRELAPAIIQRLTPEAERELLVDGTTLRDTTPEPDPSPPSLSQDDLLRGYVLYRRRRSDRVFRHSSPQEGERTRSLATTVSLGERRHVQFAIYALQDLGQVSVIASPLTRADGGALAAEAISIRPVRVGLWRDYWHPTFQEAPKLIDAPGTRTEVPKGESQQFWVTVAAPVDAQAGEYTGTLRIAVASGKPTTLALRVEVLPLRLDDGRWWGVYYYPGFGPDAPRDFADMRAHGVNAMLFCPPAYADPILEREGDRVRVSFPLADKAMKELARQGFRGPIAYFPRLLGSQVLRLFDRVDGDTLRPTEYYGQPAVQFQANEFPEDLKPVLRNVYRQMVAHAREAGWPPVLWYLVDEPEAELEQEWAKLEYPLFVEACPGEPTLCTAYTERIAAAIGAPLSVRVADLWRIETGAAERARAQGTQLWGIRWLSQYNTYGFPRHFAGVGLDKIGVTGFTEWTYYGAPRYSPYAQVRDKEGCYFAYTDDQDRLLSTITWEAVQEGIDDARYVAMLRRLTGEAEASGDADHQALAADARAALNDVLNSIPPAPGTLDEAELDRLRATLASHISLLVRAGVARPDRSFPRKPTHRFRGGLPSICSPA